MNVTMKRRRAQRGTSLIEVLAALGLFTVAAAALTKTTVASMRANVQSREAAGAVALLTDKLEQLRSLDPADAGDELAEGTHADPLNPLDVYGTSGGDYERTWSVTRDSPRRGIAEVTVTVAWDDGQPHEVNAVALICQTSTCT